MTRLYKIKAELEDPWRDTRGKQIQAHGTIFYEDGIYYWYGENNRVARLSGDSFHYLNSYSYGKRISDRIRKKIFR